MEETWYLCFRLVCTEWKITTAQPILTSMFKNILRTFEVEILKIFKNTFRVCRGPQQDKLNTYSETEVCSEMRRHNQLVVLIQLNANHSF